MRISETVHHQADVEQVFATICDFDFQTTKCERTGAVAHEVVIEVEDKDTADEALLVVTRRTLPTDGFPDFAARFVGSTIDVVESQRWGQPRPDGRREAVLSVEMTGTPVSLVGSVVLLPTADGGTDQRVDGELKANVPLFGGKVEKAVAPMLVKAVRAEAALAEQWRAQD